MINNDTLPTVECPKKLRAWVDKQAKKKHRLTGPYIRAVFTDLMEGRLILTEKRPDVDHRTVRLETREGE